MSPKNLNVSNKTHKNLLNNLRDKRIFQIYRKFENFLSLNQDFIVGVIFMTTMQKNIQNGGLIRVQTKPKKFSSKIRSQVVIS